MLRFLAGKLVEAALVCITVSVITFALTHWTGDLAIAIGGMDASKEETERLRSTYGLDRPLVLQYADWAGRALRGDFGTSFFSKEDVFRLILSRLPVTVILAFLSLGLGLAIAVPLGVFAATRPGSWVDRFALSLAVLGQAMPSYWSALLLILLFGVQLQILPISGTDSWLNFVLPTLALVVGGFASLTMLTKNSFMEEIRKNYVITARAKGASQARVLYRHVFRNAMLLIIAGFPAAFIGILFTGALLVEIIFSLDGLGLLGFEAAIKRDYTVMFGTLYVFTLLGLVMQIVGDFTYTLVDPRIDFEARR